jgi:MFS family permease
MGPVFGPIFGSVMAETYNWRAAFFMIVPPGIVAMALIWICLAEYKDRSRTQLDWTGFLALSVSSPIACGGIGSANARIFLEKHCVFPTSASAQPATYLRALRCANPPGRTTVSSESCRRA